MKKDLWIPLLGGLGLALLGVLYAANTLFNLYRCHTVSSSNPAATIAACNRLVDRSPSAESLARVYFSRARTETYSNLNDDALADFERAYELDPDLGDEIASQLCIPNMFDRAEYYVEACTLAVEYAPENSYYLLKRGLYQLYLQDFDAATADFVRAIEQEPAYRYEIMQSLCIPNDTDNAEYQAETCTVALRLDPENVAVTMNRGNYYLSLQDYDAAITDFKRVYELDPDQAANIVFTCGAPIPADGADKGVELCDLAISIDPEYVNSYRYRGLNYLKLGDIESARADFDYAIQQDDFQVGEVARGIREYGHFLGSEANYEGAAEMFGLVMQYETNAETLNNHAWYLALAGIKLERALIEVNQAIELGQNASYYDTRGLIRYKLRDYEQALTDYTTAIEMRNVRLAYYGRGLVYEALGDMESALADYAQFLAMNTETSTDPYFESAIQYATEQTQSLPDQ